MRNLILFHVKREMVNRLIGWLVNLLLVELVGSKKGGGMGRIGLAGLAGHQG